nr:PEP-CTERM sorting domain-containing protein [Planctomycetota bacterium]
HRLPAAYQNDGWFVGRGWLGVDKGASSNPRYYHTNYQDWLFIGRPVPEPGTLALLGLGLVCVAAVRRSRLRAS